MICPRCSGLLIAATVSVLGQALPEYSGLKCLICGFYADEVTLENRLHPGRPHKGVHERTNGKRQCEREGCYVYTYNQKYCGKECQIADKW